MVPTASANGSASTISSRFTAVLRSPTSGGSGSSVSTWRRRDEAGLPGDKAFRDSLRSHVEFGARVAQQNSRAKTDAELYPLDHVPLWD